MAPEYLLDDLPRLAARMERPADPGNGQLKLELDFDRLFIHHKCRRTKDRSSR